jgi:hypothetical protein
MLLEQGGCFWDAEWNDSGLERVFNGIQLVLRRVIPSDERAMQCVEQVLRGKS